MDTSAVEAFLQNYTDGPAWSDKCIHRLKNGSLSEVAAGLVAKHGVKPVTLDANGNWDVWGIDFRTCSDFCGRQVLPQTFNFGIFSSGSTNYLLPWLGLCAQLPYETGSSSRNLMSLCLALGSPMLITFSLMMTILNGHLASKSMKSLLSSSQHDFSDEKHHGRLSNRQLYKKYRKRLGAVYSFLLDAQQVPLRAVQVKGQFSSLLVLPENHQWWLNLRDRLEDTRRPVTFSLVAQVLFGIIAWILTVAGAYSESLGDSAQALLLSSGSLWLWLIPVILGWIFVGTQSRSGTIRKALKGEKVHIAPQPGTEDTPYPGQQSGVAIKPGLTLPLHPNPTLVGNMNIGALGDEPRWWGGSVYGDESKEGPIFNYARIFTWFCLLKTTEKAFSDIFENLEKGNTATLVTTERWQHPIGQPDEITGETKSSTNEDNHGLQEHPSSPSNALQGREDSLLTPPSVLRLSGDEAASRSRSPSAARSSTEQHGTSDKIAEYCGLDNGKVIRAYPRWSKLPSAWWNHFVWSTALAGFVQWGTTGAAIVISWLTEVKGLACRSGSYMLYGGLGTLSFLLLLTSVFLSHQAMLMYQKELLEDSVSSTTAKSHNPKDRKKKPRKKARIDSTFRAPNTLYTHTRSNLHTLVCALAVLARLAGKAIVVLNAVWIIISSLFELVGFYDSCWCTGTVLALGERAWVVLFKTAIQLREEAEPSWAGGIAMSMVVGFISLAVFFIWSRAGNLVRRGALEG